MICFVFVGWLTYQQLEAAFPEGTIIKKPHHLVGNAKHAEVGINPGPLKQQPLMLQLTYDNCFLTLTLPPSF